VEEAQTIVSAIVVPVFVLSLFAAAKLLKVGFRTAFISVLLNLTFGLVTLAAITTIPPFSAQILDTLSPEMEISIMPVIFTLELLTGAYLSSRILDLDFVRSLKLILSVSLFTLVVSVPIFFVVAAFGI